MSAAEAASRRTDPAAAPEPQPEPQPRKRIGRIEGHMPEIVDPLTPSEPENAFTATRALRHDGWTPERKRLFLERLAECGVIVEACEAARMSARSAYNLRDRDPLFAAGWDAANVKARAPLADEAYSRARNGVVERIYKDGIVVAERHRYDNRLTMAVLTRLDARIDRAEERGAAHLAVAARWDDYLDALAEDREADAAAILAPPPPEPEPDPAENAGHRELRELHPGEEAPQEAEALNDRHIVWGKRGDWWTDYPPPPGFHGHQEGSYGDYGYRRRVSEEEAAVLDADVAERHARSEAQRKAWFGFATEEDPFADAADAEPYADVEPDADVEEDADEDADAEADADGSAAEGESPGAAP